MVMVDFHTNKDIVVNASPEVIFSPVGDLPKHQELHGSGESVEVRKLTQGPTALDSMIESDESMTLGGEIHGFTAQSVVVGYETPKTISWIPAPPFPLNRIQWWFRLSPAGQGTCVTHEVAVDLGEARDMMGGSKAYQNTRGADVARGFEKTLANLKARAES